MQREPRVFFPMEQAVGKLEKNLLVRRIITYFLLVKLLFGCTIHLCDFEAFVVEDLQAHDESGLFPWTVSLPPASLQASLSPSSQVGSY